MNQIEKTNLLDAAKEHLKKVVVNIQHVRKATEEKNAQLRADLVKLTADNKIVQHQLLKHGQERVEELSALIPSPYFHRCLVSFGLENEALYFGKFSFTDTNIYSWVTPAASLRFEKPGNVYYTRPDGTRREGVLQQKDQFMIAEEKIRFLATESINHERELVYQEYFSEQKKGFVLPEIVAQMEKAQDVVIRANHRGPLLISGPAGSGKTTLALHRVAFLVQSPDVSAQFPPSSIIVFVQDEGTREYFSHILPELGITGVTITTFPRWAMQVLGVEGYTYVYRYGAGEQEKDVYEFRKYEALKRIGTQVIYDDMYRTLKEVYQFSGAEETVFARQVSDNVFDRFDLTILLTLFKQQHGTLTLMQEYYQVAKNNAATKKIGRFPVSYSLMIFDEFQNYLPEQIRLAKSTLDEKNNAVMYIGDMAQQTQFGTLKEWTEAGERVPDSRKVYLQKVYRNTKQILEYIASLGYVVQGIDTARDGEAVVENVVPSVDEEVAYVRSVVGQTTGSIGILAKDKAYLDHFFHLKDMRPSVYLMTMNEAQGVEFDAVCIVGVSNDMFTHSYDGVFRMYESEKQKIEKDLLYVALTRAMNRLYVVGRASLKEVITP